jgi:hypothetical protein
MAGVSRGRSVAAGAFGFLLSIASVARADDDERAEELFRAGNAAFAEDDLHAAYDAYRAAWSLRQSFDIACNLGRTEAELMLSRDAATHLDYCVRTFSASSRSEFRGAQERFRTLFNSVRTKVGAFAITTYPEGAHVEVDGVSWGTSPLTAPVFVDPGEHRVLVRLAGYPPVERLLNVAAGGTMALRVDLTAEQGAPPPTATAPQPSADEPAPSPSPIPPPVAPERGFGTRGVVVLTGAALTAVGVGVGLGFSLSASAARDEADASAPLCDSDPSSAQCARVQSALDDEDARRDVAALSFLLAAATSAATLSAFLLLPDAKPSTQPPLGASAFVTTDALGLSFRGRY